MTNGNHLADGRHFQRHDFQGPTIVERYAAVSGNTGVAGFEILGEAIILEFQDRRQYLYSHKKPGKKHVEEMKRLARSGKGLTTYVNQYVRENYEKRLK